MKQFQDEIKECEARLANLEQEEKAIKDKIKHLKSRLATARAAVKYNNNKMLDFDAMDKNINHEYTKMAGSWKSLEQRLLARTNINQTDKDKIFKTLINEMPSPLMMADKGLEESESDLIDPITASDNKWRALLGTGRAMICKDKIVKYNITKSFEVTEEHYMNQLYKQYHRNIPECWVYQGHITPEIKIALEKQHRRKTRPLEKLEKPFATNE